jgi:hypothetical protein
MEPRTRHREVMPVGGERQTVAPRRVEAPLRVDTMARHGAAPARAAAAPRREAVPQRAAVGRRDDLQRGGVGQGVTRAVAPVPVGADRVVAPILPSACRSVEVARPRRGADEQVAPLELRAMAVGGELARLAYCPRGLRTSANGRD